MENKKEKKRHGNKKDLTPDELYKVLWAITLQVKELNKNLKDLQSEFKEIKKKC